MGDVEAALAFVVRHEGQRAMPAARWAHVLSLELGWMPPQEARAFVERARKAGLLQEDDGDLRFRLEAARVEVPRRFRPDPAAVPDAAPGGGPSNVTAPPPAGPPAAERSPAVPGRSGPGEARPAPSAADPSRGPAEGQDPFLHWARRVAEARGVELDEVLHDVAGRQERLHGLLSAEAAVLWAAQEAGLEVRAAAAEALERLA